MKTMKKKIVYFAVILLMAQMPAWNLHGTDASAQETYGLRFEIAFPKTAHAEPITGRVYAIISRRDDREPRFQTGFLGVPIWGKNIHELKPGEGAVIDETDFGYPLESIRDIPPGEYYVQGFVNIYTEFKRSDGHTLWMHDDQWEGQQWHESPGNLYSDVKKVVIDPSTQQTIELECNHIIQPIQIPPDTKWVKRIKFQSKILTEFWGQPIYLGATILLPKGYDDHPDVYYPVHYLQGHFSLNAPHRFRTDDPGDGNRWVKRGYEFYEYWISDDCPRMITVTFQHPCPYYDDSYAVNSPNVGPYGDAIMEELIPKIEETFRIIRKPYARVLSGGSTGGWIALALQVFHPDFFGGTWPLAPDPVDFRCYELVNIYEDKNAYYQEFDWLKVERPEFRNTRGQIYWTNRNYYYYEWAIGDRHRSGGNAAAWEAVYSPIGEDGYPKPLWHWYTGEIDHTITDYWRENYDLRNYMEKNWSWLGPKLVGKLHLYVGTMDNYYLNNAVVLLEEFLESTTDPYYEGEVVYGERKPHVWGPESTEIYKLFADHISRYAPQGEDTSQWKYR
jgi:hypothetical protein